MCITFSISIFVLYVPCTKNICDVNMIIFFTRRQTRWECIFYISISLPIFNVITCPHLSVLLYFRRYMAKIFPIQCKTQYNQSIDQSSLIIFRENNVKEIMYRVLHVIDMYIIGIDFVRLAISLNKIYYLENYAMHTERINGGK